MPGLGDRLCVVMFCLAAFPLHAVDDMVASPYDTVSDSFYFVDGKLVMHNKAYYRYYADASTTTTSGGARARRLRRESSDDESDSEVDLEESTGDSRNQARALDASELGEVAAANAA